MLPSNHYVNSVPSIRCHNYVTVHVKVWLQIDHVEVDCSWETLLGVEKPQTPVRLFVLFTLCSARETIKHVLPLGSCHRFRKDIRQVRRCMLFRHSDCPSRNSLSGAMASNAVMLLGQCRLGFRRVRANRPALSQKIYVGPSIGTPNMRSL